MKPLLIVSSGPLSRRARLYIELLPVGCIVECRQLAPSISVANVDKVWLDEWKGETK
jgi:hypothetical protein